MIRIENRAVQNFEIEHIAKVRSLAAECTLFLKKDDTFPLKEAGKIAVYGNGIRNTIKGGTGSGDVNVRHFVNIEEGLRNAGFEITTTAWLDAYDDILYKAKAAHYSKLQEQAKAQGVPVLGLAVLGKAMLEPKYDIPLEGEGDVAIYVLARNCGEGADREVSAGDLQLTEVEKRDILALNAKYEKFMLVLNVGGMVDLSPVKEVKNILLLGQLGTPTGDVFADIITGKANPSGKLTMTWTGIEDYSSTDGFGHKDDTYYKEGIYVGYRYFDTVGKEVVYPFGYGLSYTEFDVTPVDVTIEGQEVTVKASVKNIGSVAGKEVVQVYYSATGTKLDHAYQDLAGFAKTKELQPGESCGVAITFNVTDMAAYDEEVASYILEKGQYIMRCGNSSRNTHIAGIVEINETAVIRKLKNICDGDKVEEVKPVMNPYTYEGEAKERENAKVIVFDTASIVATQAVYSEVMSEVNGNEKITWDEVKAGNKSIEEFVGALSNEELAYTCIGVYKDENSDDSAIGAAAFSVAGAAGETTHRLDKSHNLEKLVLADGPAGIRLSSAYKIVDGIVKGTTIAFGADVIEFLNVEEDEQLRPVPPTQAELEATEYYQYCVAIPIGTEIAQSFNMELAETIGDLVGDEMEMFGVHLWLAPALNIHRSPLCGRNFEYYSEDPLVSGLVAAAITNGVQAHKGCATTIKHYACNNQETNRYSSNSILSERALREIYLRGFEICVNKSHPRALMTSYNLVNGEHACSSKDLQTYVLRDEWGYDGLVMTDWLVTTEIMINEGSKHREASAAGCLKAGNDLIMPGTTMDFEDIMKALEDESHPYHITRAELQTCAIRILKEIKELNN